MDTIIDGLNLARGMSFKNIAAGIPFGGCKSVVVCPPVDLEDMETLGFIAYCIDRTRSFTGPDMGLSPSLADVMNEKFSRNFGGGLKGNIGPRGAPTAYGNLLAIQAACEFLDGSPSLAGKTAAVMGVGSVGGNLARYLLAEGAGLLVSDAHAPTLDAFLASLGGADRSRVSVVAAEHMLAQEADVFAPCAVGGILDETTIPGLRFRMILGSANNVLKASSQEEEIRLAGLLKAAGVLYQVEWVQSVGGVLSGIETYLRGPEASMDHVHQVCRERVPAATRYNLGPPATWTSRPPKWPTRPSRGGCTSSSTSWRRPEVRGGRDARPPPFTGQVERRVSFPPCASTASWAAAHTRGSTTTTPEMEAKSASTVTIWRRPCRRATAAWMRSRAEAPAVCCIRSPSLLASSTSSRVTGRILCTAAETASNAGEISLCQPMLR